MTGLPVQTASAKATAVHRDGPSERTVRPALICRVAPDPTSAKVEGPGLPTNDCRVQGTGLQNRRT
jgi:hypothetical protein